MKYGIRVAAVYDLRSVGGGERGRGVGVRGIGGVREILLTPYKHGFCFEW